MTRLADDLAHLRHRPAPGEADAEDRAWRVVESVLAEEEAEKRRPEGAPWRRSRREAARAGGGMDPGSGAPSRRAVARGGAPRQSGARSRGPAPRRSGAWTRRPAPRRILLVAAVLGLAATLALTPAGAEVGNWVEDRFDGDAQQASAFAGLPDTARVLAVSRTGAFVVSGDGAVRHLGDFSEAAWSPRGLFVVGVRGRRLTAVDPRGNVRWSLSRPSPPRHPAWSPGDGYRVAYVEGRSLRVVAGDGSGDRLARRGVVPLTPAWRPGAGHFVTVARTGGVVETLDADSGRRIWRKRLTDARGTRVVALEWDRIGRRLAVLTPRRLHVLTRDGQQPAGPRLPGGDALAIQPSGERAAVAVGDRVLSLELGRRAPHRRLFAAPGGADGLAWSPDGTRLLVGWRDADQWLLLGPGRRARALSRVSEELGADAAFPRVGGWCCADG